MVPFGALPGTHHRTYGLLGRGPLLALPARELSVSLQLQKLSQAFPLRWLPGASLTRWSRYGGPPPFTCSPLLPCLSSFIPAAREGPGPPKKQA